MGETPMLHVLLSALPWTEYHSRSRNGKRIYMKLVIAFLFLCTTFVLADDIHVIQVVDSVTGRGVPCVQLETVNHIRLLTDSNGIAVFDEPGLMNTKVFFTITSDGYEYPKDGFGYAGVAIDTTPNAKTVIK